MVGNTLDTWLFFVRILSNKIDLNLVKRKLQPYIDKLNAYMVSFILDLKIEINELEEQLLK
jgi:hypothetical protein